MTLLYHGIFLFFLSCCVISDANKDKVIPHEPMAVIRSFLPHPSEEQLLLWKPLLTTTSRDKLLKDIEKHTKHLIDTKAFVLSLNGQILLEHFPSDMQWNTSHIIPYPNLVTFVMTSLSILFEGFRPDVLMRPLPEIVQGTDVIIPEAFRNSNLMDLLGKTPEGFEIETKHFLVSYETQAYVALQVVNSLLRTSLNDAWRDLCMSLQLDNSIINEDKKLVSPFTDLYHFTEVVHSDLTSLPVHPPEELHYDRSEHYVLGWWINGGYDGLGHRLLDVLPDDALFSFSPTVQIFVIPSLKMSAVMVNNPRTSWNQKTVAEILTEDNEIWRQVLMVSNPSYHDAYTKEKEEREKRESKEKEDMIRVTKTQNEEKLKEEIVKVNEDIKKVIENEEKMTENTPQSSDIFDTILTVLLAPIKGILYLVYLYLDFAASQHVIVRVLLFVGWIVIGHSVVSGIFHTIWFILRLISSRTYQPRPKLAANAAKDD